MKQRWDIFCRVVDNYGDIGVCWRLARQLLAEYGIAVRLWVDDLASFAQLCPELNPSLETQQVSAVEVRHWGTEPCVDDIGDAVIEAFACELPETALAAMRARSIAPAWINLEYLSAEDWVEGCHGLASPQADGLKKYFFFPGFTAQTGGVLGEQAMRNARTAWSANDAEQWLTRFAPAIPDALRISLFAYENAAVEALLDAWSDDPQSDRAIVCYVPAGRLLPQVAAWAGVPLAAGSRYQRGALTLHVLPFLEQDDYDRLLWSCDINFVRGEDSFVRAQWAAKPMIWHIYRQEEQAHLLKLAAFLQRYAAVASATVLMQAWNTETLAATQWRDYLRDLSVHQSHAEHWAAQLAAHGDLADNLHRFVQALPSAERGGQ